MTRRHLRHFISTFHPPMAKKKQKSYHLFSDSHASSSHFAQSSFLFSVDFLEVAAAAAFLASTEALAASKSRSRPSLLDFLEVVSSNPDQASSPQLSESCLWVEGLLQNQIVNFMQEYLFYALIPLCAAAEFVLINYITAILLI